MRPRLLGQYFKVLRACFDRLARTRQRFFGSVFLLRGGGIIGLPHHHYRHLNGVNDFTVSTPICHVTSFPSSPKVFGFRRHRVHLGRVRGVQGSNSFFCMGRVVLFSLCGPPFSLRLNRGLRGLLYLRQSTTCGFRVVSFPKVTRQANYRGHTSWGHSLTAKVSSWGPTRQASWAVL